MKNIIKLLKGITLVNALMFTAGAGMAQQPAKATVPNGKPVLPVIKAPIVGKGKAYADKISLRWNIDEHLLFNNLVQGGVLIDRLIIGKDNKAEAGGWKRVTADTIRALPLNAFNTPGLKNDTAKMIVAQSLYGRSEYPKGLGLMAQVKLQDEEKQNRHLITSLYAALSPSAAFSAGLGYDDKITPDTAKKYVYRIIPAKKMAGIGTIDTGYIYVIGHDLAVKPTYEGLKARGTESHITLSWEKDKSPFTGYYIDRSEDQVHFKRVSKSVYLPQTDTLKGVVNYIYVDSVANYKRYYYRLTGVNAFGERYTYTDVAMGIATDHTAPQSPELKFSRVKDDITFTWNTARDKDLKGYYLIKGKGLAASDTVADKQMLAPSATKYQFKLPADFTAAYYRLLAADTSGNVSFSNPVYIFNPDSIPPAPPVGLTGKIDRKGQVTLSWKPDQAGDVLRGYKVFIGNDPNQNFVAVSNIVPDTAYTFSTTLKTLTKNLFVKVIALDASYNPSKYSAPLRLARPDTIAPPQPVLLDYVNNSKGIKLSWTRDKSDDFSHYLLYRRVAGDTAWISIQKTRTVAYLDSSIVGGKAYEYSLRTVDSTGLASPFAFPLSIKTATVIKADEVTLTGNYESAKKLVILKWNKPAQPVKFYILYKDMGQGLTMYKSIPATAQIFTDEGRWPAANLYGLKIVYADSAESDIYILK